MIFAKIRLVQLLDLGALYLEFIPASHQVWARSQSTMGVPLTQPFTVDSYPALRMVGIRTAGCLSDQLGIHCELLM